MRNAPGRTILAEHRIETRDARSIRQVPYRLPYAYKDEVLKHLKEMRENGIIEPLTSEWCPPIVLVKKKDERYECVSTIDHWTVSHDLSDTSNTQFDRWRAKHITIDLTQGYLLVPVVQASRSKTAFVTPLVLFQFRVMPFGLHGAPAMFQWMMDRLLDGRNDFSGAYLNDLVIHSTSWDEHI